MKNFPLFIITLFILSHADAAGWAALRKGPYLSCPGGGKMTVHWQLDGSAECLLEWGSTPDCGEDSTLTSEISADAGEHIHIHTIDGLIPKRRYYYRVSYPGGQSAGSFKSAPAASDTSVKFFAYGDTRSYPAQHELVMARILREVEADEACRTFLLHTGDWCENDTEASWDGEYFNRSYEKSLRVQASLPIYGVRGNHEYDAVYYKKYWPYPYVATGCYYSFDYGPAHFAVVDQYVDYSSGSPQLDWLDSDLAASAKPWKFVLLHEPGYSAAGMYLNNADVQTLIHPLCVQRGVRAVFAGHNHYYARCVVDGVHHLTLAGGGGPLYFPSSIGTGLVISESSLHFAKISIDGDKAWIEIIRPDGSYIETFTISNSGAAVDDPPAGFFVRAYPNPCGRRFCLETAVPVGTSVRVNLSDAMGRTLFSKEYISSPANIDVSGFARGCYFLSVAYGGIKHIEKLYVY